MEHLFAVWKTFSCIACKCKLFSKNISYQDLNQLVYRVDLETSYGEIPKALNIYRLSDLTTLSVKLSRTGKMNSCQKTGRTIKSGAVDF